MTKKRLIGGILGVLVLVVCMLCPVDPAVWSPKAVTGLGCLFCAIIWMIFGFVPDYVAAISMSLLFVLTKCVPLATAFSAFAGSTVWIMIGALTLGTAAGQCGFLRRCALMMMKALPATYIGQSLAFILSGLVMSPLVPSTAAKSTIITPMAYSTSQALGIEGHTKPAVGMFMAAYTGYILSSTCYLSGSFVSYSLTGLIADTQPVSWLEWFLWGLPFLVVMFVLMTIIILVFYKPKEKVQVTKDFVQKQLDEMGPWTWQQKLVGCVLVVCLILWILERTVSIDSCVVACAGAMIVLASNILSRKDFRAKVPWDSILLIGCFVSVGSVFTALELDTTLGILFGSQLSFIVGNPFILVIGLSLITFVFRFVLQSMTTSATLTTVMLMPFCAGTGVSPFILIFVAYAASNIWFLSYQTSPMLMSIAATDNQMVRHSEVVKASFQYAVVCIIGLLVSVPFWKLMGLC